jgi:hypothetical protein
LVKSGRSREGLGEIVTAIGGCVLNGERGLMVVGAHVGR